MNYTVKERFLKYVQVDTEADPASTTSPSSEKQKVLTNILLDELKEMGINAETNDSGYVYAIIPSNIEKATKKIFKSI